MESSPVDGEVAITGPGHVHGSFTPDAARASAEQLKRDADTADGQSPAENDLEGEEAEAEPEA